MNAVAATMKLEIDKIRKEFPILHQQVNGRDLVYFDNAATSQKPQRVIDALISYYTGYNANIHRGIHTLAEKATKSYEDTRRTTRAFINAASEEEIIFTRGVTEGINLVASSYGGAFLSKGDEVTVSGFGSFKVVERAARQGRNPQTGEEMTIKARKSPVFRPGTQLKRAVE